MFLSQTHRPSPARLAAPPGAKDALRRSRTAWPGSAWRQLAMGMHVSQPHEASEREADRAADAVLAGKAVALNGGTGGASIHRACIECEAERGQRDQEQSIQAKRKAGADEPTAADAGAPGALEGHGQPLPSALRGEFEPRFGHDFSAVRLHTDERAAASARAFNALAYTQGRNVVFGAGQFDPSSSGGRHLIAHELAHVVQQSTGASPPALQRKGGPLDLQPDVCITVPLIGKPACGSDAAKICGEAPSIPGCGAVCAAFDCHRPNEPKTLCLPGWRAATSKGHEGECCRGPIDSATSCCVPGRVALLDDRCCGPQEAVVNNRCQKRDAPTPSDCSSGQKTFGGECCEPPKVALGFKCVEPAKPVPPVPPQPAPVVLPPFHIFFKLDRPQSGETSAGLSASVTTEGKANFDALVITLKADATQKVQLLGRASPEGTDAYNEDLGARRAGMVAAALMNAGIPESRIGDPSVPDLGPDCKPIGTGIATCGKSGSAGERDREVRARVFATGVP